MTKKSRIDLRKLDLEKECLPYERAHIRWIRHNDPEEMRRLVSIDLDENVRRYVLEVSGEEAELRDFAVGTKKSVGIAIAGKRDHVGEGEYDRLQGWIAVYPDHPNRLKRAQAKGLLAYDGEKVYLEIGFARYPQAKSGQMGSALRSVIHALRAYFKKQGISWVLTGYTHPNNDGSKKVLVSAGFKHVGELPYILRDKHSDYLFLLEV